MCGRFSLIKAIEEVYDYLFDQFDIDEITEFDLPRYNVAPGQKIICIINDGLRYRVGEIKWGFVPSFSTDENIGYKMINARGESINQKVSFKDSFKNKRCLILADGYYEWRDKKPYRIKIRDKELFVMAGIYDRLVRRDGSKLFTCAILTTNASEILSDIHERMPVILTEKEGKVWLDKNSSMDLLKSLINPFDDQQIEFYRVSDYVNKVANQSKECIKPIE